MQLFSCVCVHTYRDSVTQSLPRYLIVSFLERLAQFFYGRRGAAVARRGHGNTAGPRRRGGGGEQEGYGQRCLGDGVILSFACDLLKQSLSNTNGAL